MNRMHCEYQSRSKGTRYFQSEQHLPQKKRVQQMQDYVCSVVACWLQFPELILKPER